MLPGMTAGHAGAAASGIDIMRLATIRTPSGTSAATIQSGSAELLDFEDAGAVLWALADGRKLEDLPRVGAIGVDGAMFAPPVLRPEKIVCVGLNFGKHAAEAKRAKPDYPMLFAKYSRALIGATDDIVLPPESEMCDWEAELAVVVGTTARRVSVAQALDVVAGYSVLNDISMRNFQRHTNQFLPGKTFERSTPVGPWIVSAEDVDDARDLRVRCLVNGEVRQEGSTADMTFSVAEVIAYVSSFITLVPGDVIAMGTPDGVGATRTPPLFLKDGDVVVTEVEHVGTLTNRCRSELVNGAMSELNGTTRRMAGAEM